MFPTLWILAIKAVNLWKIVVSLEFYSELMILKIILMVKLYNVVHYIIRAILSGDKVVLNYMA